MDDPESLDELVERVVPAYRAIIEAHKDEDGVVAIVGHGGSIGWVMPYFAENVTLDVVLSNNLRNTGIVEVRLDSAGRPMVADWDGIAALTGDPEHIVHACALDPLTGAVLTLKKIREMAAEMLAAEAQWLPQFAGKAIRPTPTVQIPADVQRAEVPVDPALAIMARFGELGG